MNGQTTLTRFTDKIGKRHVELARSWAVSGAVYGAVAFCALVYFTDWKVIAKNIPIYNTKFKKEA